MFLCFLSPTIHRSNVKYKPNNIYSKAIHYSFSIAIQKSMMIIVIEIGSLIKSSCFPFYFCIFLLLLLFGNTPCCSGATFSSKLSSHSQKYCSDHIALGLEPNLLHTRCALYTIGLSLSPSFLLLLLL